MATGWGTATLIAAGFALLAYVDYRRRSEDTKQASIPRAEPEPERPRQEEQVSSVVGETPVPPETSYPSLLDHELADPYFKGRMVRISELARKARDDYKGSITTISGRTFDDCVIFGPAVLLPMNTEGFNSQNFVGECFWLEMDNAFWTAGPEDHRDYVGVIGLEDCIFRSCEFIQVGVLVDPERYEEKRMDTTNP